MPTIVDEDGYVLTYDIVNGRPVVQEVTAPSGAWIDPTTGRRVNPKTGRWKEQYDGKGQ